MAKRIKIYVAGKVSKESGFGTHHWRDDFIKQLEGQTGTKITNLDPTRSKVDQSDPETVFGADAHMVSQADVVVVYLSDDISVGGSQEILIAKYFGKPVIGLAPLGGKFNGGTKEMFGQKIKNYKDPFVFTTCDIVCKDINEVADSLKIIDKIKPKNIDMIQDLVAKYCRSA